MTALIASGDIVARAPSVTAGRAHCTAVVERLAPNPVAGRSHSTRRSIRPTGRAGSRGRVETFRCLAATRQRGPALVARSAAKAIARGLAVGASVFAVLLLTGLGRTWIADFRRRNKDVEEKPLSSGTQLSSAPENGAT